MVDILFRQRLDNVQHATPTEGGTVTMNTPLTGDLTLILDPATPLNAVTLQWLTVPQDGQRVNVLATRTILSLTNSGGTLNRAVSTILGATSFCYAYDASNSTWMQVFNGTPSANMEVTIPYTAIVAGGAGVATFYPTSNGTSGGTATFAVMKQINPRFDSGNPNLGNDKPVASVDLKTITIACKFQSFSGVVVLGINVLGAATVGNAPNGTALTVYVTGILNV